MPAGWSGGFPLPAEAGWQGVADPGRLPAGAPDWRSRDPQRRAEAAHADELKRPKPVVGIGGGVRIGADTTNGMVSGRLGHELSSSVALSLRPALILGNADLRGRRNNQSEFQLPLTVDLFPRAVLSPYIGGGIVNNANSSGRNEGMLSAGLDLNLSRHLTVGVTLNRIFQDRSNDNAWEGLTQIYVRY
ncbi:MAG: hypothetical protein VKI83_08285 [Synechococcaceae cyanobacterium]|nr:hypothetical protein [Synechococcaceae cyanobacterium]